MRDPFRPVSLATDDAADPLAQSDFTQKVAGDVAAVEPGHQCYKIAAVPPTVTAGSNATIQLEYRSQWSGQGDELPGRKQSFYACADIVRQPNPLPGLSSEVLTMLAPDFRRGPRLRRPSSLLQCHFFRLQAARPEQLDHARDAHWTWRRHHRGGCPELRGLWRTVYGSQGRYRRRRCRCFSHGSGCNRVCSPAQEKACAYRSRGAGSQRKDYA